MNYLGALSRKFRHERRHILQDEDDRQMSSNVFGSSQDDCTMRSQDSTLFASPAEGLTGEASMIHVNRLDAIYVSLHDVPVYRQGVEKPLYELPNWPRCV